MKDEDWKKMLINWYNSRKNSELKKKINDNKMKNLNDKQVLELIREIFEYSLLSEEEKQSTDWIDQEMIDMSSKRIILEELIKTLTKWYVFQVIYEEKEEFEMCAYIRDVVDIEVGEAKRLVRTYFMIDDTDDALYENIKSNCRVVAYKTIEG